MSKFLTPPVWYDYNENLVEILTGKIDYYGATRLTGSMAIGKNAYVGGNDSVAVGDRTIIYDTKTTAIGHNAVSRGNGNIVIGYQAKSSSGSGKGGNVAIGQNTVIYGDGSIAIGSGITLGAGESPVSDIIQIGATGKPYTFQVGNRNVFDAINIAEKTFYINDTPYKATYDPDSATLNFITM